MSKTGSNVPGNSSVTPFKWELYHIFISDQEHKEAIEDALVKFSLLLYSILGVCALEHKTA